MRPITPRGPSAEPPRYLRVKEAVEQYRVGKTRLYSLIGSKLSDKKIGNTRVFLVEELERLAE